MSLLNALLILQRTDFTYNVSGTMELGNEIHLLKRIRKFENTVIRVSSEGFKKPKIPAWWTSFEEGTLKDFVAEYKKKVCAFLLDD